MAEGDGAIMLLVHSADSLKTLAFAVPILQQLAVVLIPTWEIAMQIGDSFRILGRSGMNLRKMMVTGGRDTIKQRTIWTRGTC